MFRHFSLEKLMPRTEQYPIARVSFIYIICIENCSAYELALYYIYSGVVYFDFRGGDLFTYLCFLSVKNNSEFQIWYIVDTYYMWMDSVWLACFVCKPGT